MNQNK